MFFYGIPSGIRHSVNTPIRVIVGIRFTGNKNRWEKLKRWQWTFSSLTTRCLLFILVTHRIENFLPRRTGEEYIEIFLSFTRAFVYSQYKIFRFCQFLLPFHGLAVPRLFSNQETNFYLPFTRNGEQPSRCAAKNSPEGMPEMADHPWEGSAISQSRDANKQAFGGNNR